MAAQTEALLELMLIAEVYCSRAECVAKRLSDREDVDELRLKISQARNTLERLQQLYNADKLTLADPVVCGNFRFLSLCLLWSEFRLREHLDYRLFRMVVQVEAGFTYQLIAQCHDSAARQGREDR